MCEDKIMKKESGRPTLKYIIGRKTEKVYGRQAPPGLMAKGAT